MRSILTCFILFAATILAQAQAPVNDNCSGLIDLGVLPYCSSAGEYTNVNATTSVVFSGPNNVPSCFNNAGDRDVWFQFTPPVDGSIVDVVVTVTGNVNGNGTMRMPQIAIYRGDCEMDGLDELDCIFAPLNVNEISLELFGLTPGLPYFLRINDYSASATPNAGTFKLCVEEYVADIIMGTTPGTQSCSGTLYDSGGPDGDYSNNENLTFTVCPTEFHQCLIFNVVNYATEANFDDINFFEGEGIGGTEIISINGDGSNFEVQISTPCATIQFDSDNSSTDPGFQITWTCSPDACNVPPPTSCTAPALIPSVPFTANDLSNCFSGNSVNTDPCGNNFLAGNDYLMSYTSPGDECVTISLTGTDTGTGIGVYSSCPGLPGATCLTSAGGGFNQSNPTINSVFFENPGTYFIAIGAGANGCTPFSINIDTITCPVVLPPASTCDQALNIGGCSTLLPETIALNPGAGDPNFLVDGVNQGCFVNPQENFAFFYFKAAGDGKFGFAVQAALPDEDTDIDFNVWGPIPNVDQICEYVTNNQPIRSSWAGGADLTGLADIHPVTGEMVDDDFDCGSVDTPGAGGDDFVRRIDVLEGEIYVILLDDFGNTIEQGGISIDFGDSDPPIFEDPDSQFTVTTDTAICPGQTVQLEAAGGVVYAWTPENTLTCSNCPNPVASPTTSTTYNVEIVSTCKTVNKNVTVKYYEVNLGPDVTICNEASFQLNANPFEEVQYVWNGPGLSCTDCPSPTISGLTTGSYVVTASLITPICTLKDTLNITVVPGIAANIIMAEDSMLCIGESYSLGGAFTPGVNYTWTSFPSGFTSNQSNPQISPSTSATYYLSATNVDCPFPTLDSVRVNVSQLPVIAPRADTTICQGQSVIMGTTSAEGGVTYTWSPNDASLTDINAPNPTATPTTTTTYTLAATNLGCELSEEVVVTVTNINVQLTVPDSLTLCLGTAIPYTANVTPANTTVTWSPSFNLQLSNNGATVIATPDESQLYVATVSVPGCVRKDSVYFHVDSLPYSLTILPADTTICQGSQVQLLSNLYQPSDFPRIIHEWTPTSGQLTPDSLYNMVVQPDETTVYQRITQSGACLDTTTATVNVVPSVSMTITPPNPQLCEGDTVQLTLTYPAGVTNIEWMPATGLSCTNCNTPIASPSTTTTYTAEGEFNGCPVMTNITISVNTPPAVQIPDDKNLCKGQSIQLNSASTPGATYTWTSNNPAFATSTNPTPTITPDATYTYQLTATNGCVRTQEFTVTVAESTITASNDTSLCKNLPVTLSANGSLPGGTYAWSPGGSGQTITVTPQQTTTYTVTYSFGDNCTVQEQVVVNINGEAVNFNTPTDLSLCLGESSTLNTIAFPGATYAWTSVPAGFTSASATPTVTPSTSTTYTVTGTNGLCVNTATVALVVDNQTVTLPADQSICPGSSTQLTATTSGSGGTFLWSNGDTGSNISAEDSTATYSVVYTYGDGCTAYDTTVVTVLANFDVNITADPAQTTFDEGDPVVLTANIIPTQNTTGFTYSWKKAGIDKVIGTTAIITADNIYEGTETTEDSIKLNYQVTVISPNGCEIIQTIPIFVRFTRVEIPDAFSPNGDGTNDTFAAILKGGKATFESMQIFNRWGNEVFKSEGNAPWDGKQDGKETPTDVYYYVITYRDSTGSLIIKNGEITLLR